MQQEPLYSPIDIESMLANPLMQQLQQQMQQQMQQGDVRIARRLVEQPAWRLVADEALDRVAVLGLFEPDDVLPRTLDRDDRARALNALATESDEGARGRGHLWQLKPDARRNALERLQRSRRLQRTIDANPPRRDDRFGIWLQRALQGTAGSIGKLRTDELRELLTAVEFTQGLGGAVTDPALVRRELERRVFNDQVASVLPRQVIGRRKEIAEIAAQLRSGESVPLLVSGIGGSGKSTVLAAAVRKVSRARPPVPVIVLDFDRPECNAGNVAELTLEFTRQIGLIFPSLYAPVQELIAEARREQQRRYGEDLVKQSVDVQGYLSSSVDRLVFDRLRGLVAGALGLNAPIGLVLDTFEEVFAQGDDAVRRVLTWVEQFRYEAGFGGLATVISGRSVHDAFRELPQPMLEPGRIVEIGELDHVAAARLLRMHQVSDEAALPLARSFGGNPLMLLLLATFLAENPDTDPLSLTSDVPRHERRTPAVAMRYLYDRILRHVRDDDVRKLANPGLLLRRVTPTLIREVLAKPCDLGPVDDARARALFDRLARHVWLVERRGTDEVMHRRDLRRIMMPLVTEADRGRARAIHRAAVAYYRHATSGVPEVNQAEQLYHRVLAGQVKRLGPAQADLLGGALGTDLDDLPAAVRTVVKARRDLSLTPEEIRTLPAPERARRVEKELTNHLLGGRVEAARDLVQRALPRSELERLEPFQRLRLAHAAGDLQQLRHFAPRLGRAITARNSQWVPSDLGDDPVWATIALLAVNKDPLLPSLVAAVSRARPSLRTSREFEELLAAARTLAEFRGYGLRSDTMRLSRKTPSRLPPGALVLRHALFLRKHADQYDLRLSSLPIFQPAVARTLLSIATLGPVNIFHDDHELVVKQLRWIARITGSSAPKEKRRLRLMRFEAITRTFEAGGITVFSDSLRRLPRLLRGGTPEFRAPLVSTLIDAFPSESGKRRLARLAMKALPVYPLEFRPDHFGPAAQRDPRRWITPLVDLLDRAGSLSSFVRLALQSAERRARLKPVVHAYVRWDRLLNSAARINWRSS